MTTSDTLLLTIGALVAVATLVRMMLARRDQLVAEVKQQVTESRRDDRQRRRDDHSPEAADEAA